MGKYKLIVLTNPVEGREKEYNDWYTNRHLGDVVSVPGFASAQRFKLKDPMGFSHPFRYLAIYEIEGDNIELVLKDMFERRGTDAMVVSDALDSNALAGVFEVCSPVVTASQVKDGE